MTIAFVLGNGVSRSGVPLNDLKQRGKIYGCNALYRDFVPDCLVSTDKPISAHIQESGYSQHHRFHTRRPLENSGAKPVPQEYFGFSSGPIAVALSALDNNRKIYLLGFDMGPALNQKFNNIYADTDFYKKSDAPPTYTGNWVKQICRIASDFSSVQFVRVCGKTTANIPEFDTVRNLSNMKLLDFLDRINNQKDL